MKQPNLSEISQQVVYRFVGGKPEDGILSCGFMRKPSAQKSQIDFRIPYYSCFVLLDGGGKYWDETGFSADIRPGSVVQRLPGRLHSTKVNGDGKWLEFYVSFGKCVCDSMQALDQLGGQTPVGCFSQAEQQIPAFQKLLAQMSTMPDRMLTSCLLDAQLLAHNLTSGSGKNADVSPAIAKACEILEKDLRKEYSLEAVSRKIYIGYETFRKQFYREMGISPDDYRQQKRMMMARMMLMEGESVKSVAKTLGYSDAYAFSKQFRRFAGISPTFYNRNWENKEG